jgi:hypothetical protein
MDAQQFRDMFHRLANVNRWDLEGAGLIPEGKNGDAGWTRFNRDLTTFVLKAPVEKLPGLIALALPTPQTGRNGNE